MKKTFAVQWTLAGVLLPVMLLAQTTVVGQNTVPYLPIPPRTVNTNGATILRDYSVIPGSPSGPPSLPTSPTAAVDFQGLTDNNTWFPPDTQGAVGTNYIVTMLNTQTRIQRRDGTVVQTLLTSNFWLSANIGNFSQVFDPRIEYDPYNNRWIACALVDAGKTSSRVLIGVSRTSDPTTIGDSGWNLRQVYADPASQRYADYPMMGFNKDWIVVSANMWLIQYPYSFDRSDFFVFNKTNLYAGNFTSPTILADTTTSHAGDEFPAVTYDDSASTLYVVQDSYGNAGGNGYVRILTITGNIGSETLNNAGSNPVYLQAATTWGWNEPNNGADFAPQIGAPSLVPKVQNNDASIGNVVYRNGYLWFAHTAFLPTSSPTHSAIQWYQVAPDLGIIQLGRIEDTTASNYFAFPSIAVNRFNDVLIGFSRYSAGQYVGADYAFRAFNDPLNMTRPETEFKGGEDSYYKQQGGNPPRNRWGDYSATVVDPLNDEDFWTEQEYAAPHVGALMANYSGRWGTWVANVTVTVPPNDFFTNAITLSGSEGTTNGTNIRATKESGEPNHAGNSGGASVWYNWTAPSSGSVDIDTIGSDFDTTLGVYTGSSVGSLTAVASDDDSGGNGASRVIFTATAGTTYRIAVDGYDGAMGNLTLNWIYPVAPFFTTQPEDQTKYVGEVVSFSAEALGNPAPTYQWRFNGYNVGGFTSSNISFTVQANNAGIWDVVAANSFGSVTSAPATLNVLVHEATFSAPVWTNNQFQMTIAKAVNDSYIVQANTNLSTTNWVSITTNTAPFTFADPAATNYPMRFYRAIYKP